MAWISFDWTASSTITPRTRTGPPGRDTICENGVTHGRSPPSSSSMLDA